MKSGWVEKPLGECFKLKSGDGLTSKMMNGEGIYPVFGGNGIVGLHGEFNLSGSNVIIGRVGALCGNARHITEEIWLTDNAFKIVNFNHEFDLSFLTYLLNYKNLRSFARQAAQPVISNSSLKDIPLQFPTSISEQQQIVAMLDDTFAALNSVHANAERNRVNAGELFEGYLQSAFENTDGSWDERMLQDVVDADCSLSYGIVQPGSDTPNGLPVIRPTDLTRKFINLEGLKRIDPRIADTYKRTSLIGNELLLCVRGSTGTVSLATTELKGANVTRGIVPIRFNSEIINQEFGYYLLTSPTIQQQIKAKTYGAALMQINIGDLRKILISFPKLKEQCAIVERLDALSAETKKLEETYRSKLNAAGELRKAILHKAFEGGS